MHDTTSDAAAIFLPLWKRKWLILAVGLLAAAGTYLYYKRQPATYTASTRLYLGAASEQQALVGGGGGKALNGRALADQVELINSSAIGEVVRKKLRAEHQLAAAKGKAKATASPNSDFITIATEARKPKAAARLADTYAAVYAKRQRSDYMKALSIQIANARQQLRRIEPVVVPTKGKGPAKGPSSSQTIQAANLASKISQLENQLSSYNGVQQVSRAQAAPLPVSPTPKKNAIFGGVLGLLLAGIVAYMTSRFDRRIRSLAEIESIFKTQILAALPAVRSPVVRPSGERAPAKSLVEPLRRLQVTLKLGDSLANGAAGGTRAILFLGADPGDGKSSLIANLARVQSDAGERVAVIEADFRRPVQARLLDVSGPYGLGDVLAGRVQIADAIQSVRLPQTSLQPGDERVPVPVSTVVEPRGSGSLSALVSGAPIANPPALLASGAMAELLGWAREEFDRVLIDAPSPLEVSDVMPLLALVDGLVLVARVGHTRETSAQRLAQLLERSASAPVLGAVANCVPRKDMEKYGLAWAPAAPVRSDRSLRRLVRR